MFRHGNPARICKFAGRLKENASCKTLRCLQWRKTVFILASWSSRPLRLCGYSFRLYATFTVSWHCTRHWVSLGANWNNVRWEGNIRLARRDWSSTGSAVEVLFVSFKTPGSAITRLVSNSEHRPVSFNRMWQIRYPTATPGKPRLGNLIAFCSTTLRGVRIGAQKLPTLQ